MKAVLLAAGLGSRLRPLTNTIPKCLVPINGKPLIDFWLELLTKNSHIDEIFINVSYLKEQVVTHLHDHWSDSDKLTIWHENKLLGTAGTLAQNYQSLGGNEVLVIHADNLSKFNLDTFIEAHTHRPSDTEGTMLLFETDVPESCGIVELDTLGRLIQMHEKVENPPGNLANGAVYLFSEAIVDWIHKNDAKEITTEVIPAFNNKLFTWQNTVYHRDIGTPESYLLAQQEFTKID